MRLALHIPSYQTQAYTVFLATDITFSHVWWSLVVSTHGTCAIPPLGKTFPMKGVATQDSKKWPIELFQADRAVVLLVVEQVFLGLFSGFSCRQNTMDSLDVAYVLL